MHGLRLLPSCEPTFQNASLLAPGLNLLPNTSLPCPAQDAAYHDSLRADREKQDAAERSRLEAEAAAAQQAAAAEAEERQQREEAERCVCCCRVRFVCACTLHHPLVACC